MRQTAVSLGMDRPKFELFTSRLRVQLNISIRSGLTGRRKKYETKNESYMKSVGYEEKTQRATVFARKANERFKGLGWFSAVHWG